MHDFRRACVFAGEFRLARLLSLGCLLLGWMFSVGKVRAKEEVWKPAETWVFAAGVLRFDDPSLATWPDKGRVDAQMVKAYAARGVPADHIVFLKDEEATRARVMEKLAASLRAAGPQGFFIFYYAGHGGRDYHDPARPVSLVTYDTASDLRLKDVLGCIEANFKGRRVLLTADCCYSGGLAEEARRHDHGGITYGILTSAQATSTSTGNWTFTQVLTDLLNGDPRLDLNHDGRLTLREAGTYANEEMAFCEGQLATFETTGDFPADLVLAEAHGSATTEPADAHCEARYRNQWLKVKVLKTEGTRSFVHWIGWKSSDDSWVDAGDLRPYKPQTLAAGASVEIEWNEHWYPGRVLRSEKGLQLVHYDGFDDIDDEWVAVERLKRR